MEIRAKLRKPVWNSDYKARNDGTIGSCIQWFHSSSVAIPNYYLDGYQEIMTLNGHKFSEQ